MNSYLTDRLIDLERFRHHRLQFVEIGPILDDEIFSLTESIRHTREGGAGQRHRKCALSHLGLFHPCLLAAVKIGVALFASSNSRQCSATSKRENVIGTFGEQPLATLLVIGLKNSRDMTGGVQRRSRLNAKLRPWFRRAIK
jgi:hypothetical protein